jgi:hypothetical protein
VRTGASAAFVRPSAHDALGDLVTARQLQPVLLKAEKILADILTRCSPGLAGAARGMGPAIFNFLGKRKRHPTASLS